MSKQKESISFVLKQHISVENNQKKKENSTINIKCVFC
jgi:hypothetical protein